MSVVIPEQNLWDVTINDVVKIAAEEGDMLLVNLPPQSEELPNRELEAMYHRVAKSFEAAFSDKDVRILVVPYGMEVSIIKSGELKDK